MFSRDGSVELLLRVREKILRKLLTIVFAPRPRSRSACCCSCCLYSFVCRRLPTLLVTSPIAPSINSSNRYPYHDVITSAPGQLPSTKPQEEEDGSGAAKQDAKCGGGWDPLVFDSLVLEDVPGLSVEERMAGMKVQYE